MFRCFALGAALALIPLNSANAVDVSWTFTGRTIDSSSNVLTFGFVGPSTPFTAKFVFDDAMPGSSTATDFQDYRVIYGGPEFEPTVSAVNPLKSASLTINGVEWSADWDSGLFDVGVNFNGGPGGDWMTASANSANQQIHMNMQNFHFRESLDFGEPISVNFTGAGYAAGYFRNGVSNFLRLGIDHVSVAPAVLPPRPLLPPPIVPPKDLIWDINNLNPASFDPLKPTIVITHGWQSLGPLTEPPWMGEMRSSIQALPDHQDANIILVYWTDAWTPGLPTAADLRAATAQTAYQGSLLGKALSELEGEFKGGLHFIGHSLGTHVNAYAANALVKSGIDIKQFTILDRPFGDGSRLFGLEPVGGDVDQFIFRTLLPQGHVLFVDNYFGLDRSSQILGATGAPFAPGAEALDYGVAGANHSGVHEFYLSTMGSDCLDYGGGGFGCSLVGGGYPLAADLFPWNPNADVVVLPSETVQFNPAQWVTFNCQVNGESLATCSEGSPAYLWSDKFTFAADAQFLTFEYAWNSVGDGDWLTLHFDDILLYSGKGTLNASDIFLSSGFISVEEFAGRTGQLLFSLNSVGEANASFSVKDVSVLTGAAAPVPEPANWATMILGFLLIGSGVRIQRRGGVKTRRARPLTQ